MANNSDTFHAVIEVVNRASAPLHRIEADIAGMIAPITAVTVALGALAEETGMVALAEHASLAIERVGSLGRSLGALLGPVALIGGVASAEGLLEISKKSAEFGEKLIHSSQKTGVDVPVLARLHYIAKMDDVDPEMFDKAITRLNAGLFEAMHGKNKQLNAMLVHFEGGDWHKRVKTVEDGLGMVAEAYQKAKNPFQKAEVLKDAFGQRAGANLAPILLHSKDALRALGDEFERFNGVWTPERAHEALEAAENWKRLSAAGEGLAMTIGSAITPTMMKLIEPLTEWIANNRELVASKVDHAVTQIGNALKGVDWEGVGTAVKDVWDAFKGLADTLGAKNTVFLGAALIFGPIAVEALKAAGSVALLGADLLLVSARLGFLAGASVLSFFTDFVTGIKLAIPWFSALDLALDANPIGAAVLALTALAGLGLLIYKNWDGISKWFSDLWSGIKTTLDEAWKFMEPIVNKIGNAMDRITGGQDLSKYSGANDAEASFAQGHVARWTRNSGGAGNQPYGAPFIGAPLPALHTQGGAFNAPNGQVDVNVKFDSLPRGTTTDTKVQGRGLNLNTGKSFQH